MDLYLDGRGGTAILTGMLFGITMFLNVWGVIWRNQKVVIGNAETVAAGGEANPEAPAAAKKAARASRCNTLFSDPDALVHGVRRPRRAFYGSTQRSAARSSTGSSCSSSGPSSRRRRSASSAASTAPFNKLAFDKHKHTIIGGFVLLAVICFVGWELLLPA